MSGPSSLDARQSDQIIHHTACADDVIYQLIPRTAPVNPVDIDTGESAIEIVILWGELSILHVEHISPPRLYCVGDAVDSKGGRATDFLIGRDTLGTNRLPLIVEQDSRTAVVIASGATGEISIGDQLVSFEELALQGLLWPAAEPAGAQLYPLPFGAAARVRYRGFTFVIKRVSAARKVGVGDKRAFTDRWTLTSLLLHAGLLVSFQFLPPRSSALSLDLLNADSRLVSYAMQPDETAEDPKPEWLNAQDSGESGQRHEADEGQMGERDQASTHSKLAIKGPRDNPTPQMARVETRQTAASAGIIGILQANIGAWSSPTSAFGRDTALGRDDSSAIGAITGDQIGPGFGFGGLGAVGHGRGGGGDGKGSVGIGNLGTIGQRSGNGAGPGYGNAAGSFRAHIAHVPQVRGCAADVHGSLSKEVIRREVNRHINEVRFCYQQQLNARPDLQGRVTVKFIIAPSGAVAAAVTQSSDLGSPKVEQCIAQATRRWVFPAPDGGDNVAVSYPFVLSQAGN
jgi:hypothetical protein